ncbi:MAG: DUF4142 domain-containing protein [Chitinophagaceae bacterium]|nr:MAG: DUF4142 domain-containing protein [Chitinophagaceae bacterium]
MKRIYFLVVAVLLCLASFAQDGMVGNMTVAEFNKVNEKGNQAVMAIRPGKSSLSTADQALVKEIAMGGMRQLAMSRKALNSVVRNDVRILAQSEVEEQTGIAANLKEMATTMGFSLPDSADTQGGMTGPDGTGSSVMNDSSSASADYRSAKRPGDSMRVGPGDSMGMPRSRVGEDQTGMRESDSAGTREGGQAGMGKRDQATNGTGADEMYLRESGVKGHEKLQATMMKVSSQAKDPALKALAAATLPVIRTHLKVSKSMLGKAGESSSGKSQ